MSGKTEPVVIGVLQPAWLRGEHMLPEGAQLVKSLHNEEQRSGFAALSVPTLSGGNTGSTEQFVLG